MPKKDTDSVESFLPSSESSGPQEFRPSIPQHLLDGCDDHDKFILERISVLIQQQKWLMRHLDEVHDYCSKINGKVVDLEQFRNTIELDKAKSDGEKKWKRYFYGVTILIAYPVYLAVADKAGIAKLISIFTP